jgi:outer membrane protein TolC
LTPLLDLPFISSMLARTARFLHRATFIGCVIGTFHARVTLAQVAPVPAIKNADAEAARAKIAYAAPSDAEIKKQAEDILRAFGPRRITLMEAVRNTLLNDPEVKLGDEEIHRRAAELQIEKGKFDWHLISESSVERREEDRDSAEIRRLKAEFAEAGLSPPTTVRTDTRTLSAGLAHQFRNGIGFRPFVEFSGTGTDIARREGEPDINRSDTGLELTLPLGAGRGIIATAGGEMAAKIQVDAAYWQAYHNASKRVKDTVDAYWNLVAAQERLRLFVRSEEMNSALGDLTREMIKADLVPSAEDAQVNARQLASTALRLDAEIELQRAQAELARTMGYTTKGIIYAPLAADGFPAVVAPSHDRTRVERYVNEAVRRRGDRLASLMSEGAARILVEQARRNVKPRVDVFVRGFASGHSEGTKARDFFHTWSGGLTGPGVAAGISMDWPFFRDAEKGLLSQRQSELRTLELTTMSVEQIIAQELSTSEFVLHTSGRLYDTQKKALGELERALELEREKFRLGDATAIDSVTTEERLTIAGQGLIDARLQNAIALGRLRFATATLLSGNPPSERVLQRSNLTTVPRFSRPAPVLPLDVPPATPRSPFGDTNPYRVLKSIDASATRR